MKSVDPTITRLRNCVIYPVRSGNLEFKNLETAPIAYFCMEYALHDALPIYAGGLGILAGDYVLEAGRQGIPLVAIGGFFRQGFVAYSGKRATHVHMAPDPKVAGFSLLRDNANEPVMIDVEINDHMVYFQTWVRTYGSAHVFLIDTNVPENSSEHRDITKHLYASDFSTKIFQDLMIGVGGVKLLRCLSVNPSIYHVNEGHTSFVSLALAVEYVHDHPAETSFSSALNIVREKIVSSKHTILPGAGLFFRRHEFESVIGRYLLRHDVNFEEFFALGTKPDQPDVFSTTLFMLRTSVRSNAVSILHAAFEKKFHGEIDLVPITNGIHVARWLHSSFRDNGLTNLSDRDFWERHEMARERLVEYVNRRSGSALRPRALTVTWARRFAAYKRPELLFSDLERLRKLICSSERSIQFVIAGQASMDETEGQALLDVILRHTEDSQLKHCVAYLPDYSIEDAEVLVAGSDVWLNTPERGKEACGTSSMKSGLNGGLQFSTSDGWIEEVDWKERGWILPEQDAARALYDTFEGEIIPLFYERDEHGIPTRWIERMRATASVVWEHYTTRRMLADYFNKLYFPNSPSPYQLYE